MKKTTLLILAGAAGLSAGNAHAANLLTNGGFETATISGPCCNTVNAPNSFSGWTVSAGDINVVLGTFSSSNGNLAFEGQRYLDLVGQSGTGQIVQSFATVAGTTYDFSFAFAHNLFGGLGSASGTYEILDGLNPILSGNLTHTGGSNANLAWQGQAGSFVAGSGTTIIRFTNTAGALSAGLLLDDVSVSAAVPEPSTWAMMVLGFGLVGAGLRRRSRQPTTVAFG